VTEPMVSLETSDLMILIADNSAFGIHRAGYNGVASLIPRRLGNNIFVPTYCGLNYETTSLEGLEEDAEGKFEPRRIPMEIVEHGPDRAVLHQPPSERKGIEARIEFRTEEPYYIHQRVMIRFHKRFASPSEFNSLWASYMHIPPDLHIYLRTAEPDNPLEGWIGITKESHSATEYIIKPMPPRRLIAAEHLHQMETAAEVRVPVSASWARAAPGAGEPAKPPRERASGFDPDMPLRFYYGLYYDYAFVMMFKQPQKVKLAYSPHGGGTQPAWCPAWDYILWLPDAETDRWFAWDLCLAVKPFCSREDVLEEVARFNIR